ncbi:hypothetical protein WJ47_21060 [Burkholderia ubonensis]|uniref:Uncharacterized protein n=1 Tax=Burkholderia ubonensis TaxID=101571 RepID=A0AB73FT47_9BURK|nr:hypothetical protein [Burkholderia ubonensis]KVK83478.1 hypothetical protein WJ44_00570 [Burkholderia ubonensis]KVL59448.1 hypothetical protein WJ47_21060 [Burkholderia ubonensis]KVM21573.1 hypothetical protein WJ53_19720 [Burkholderia ubonensis]KVM42895.1 hypothetical protein WJ54_26020 [Burkholderia ubonensis]
MEHKGEKYERLSAPILVGPSARIVSVAEEGGMRPLCASASVVPDSLVSAWVIPTDEEWMIASHTLDLLGA